MRIAFVITRADDIGGAQVHVRDLSSALARHGHEPVVISGEPGPLAHQLREAGIEFRSLPHLVWPLSPVRDAMALLELRQALREIGPDLVSAHSSKAGILARIACRTLGIPVIFTAHGWGFGPTRPLAERLLHRNAERLAAPLADRIITVCEANRDLAIAEGVLRPGQSVTIHNAMPDLGPDYLARPEISPPMLVMVARFAPPKDHATLLAALEGLLDTEWKLSLVGDGPAEAEMRSRIERGPLASRVTLLGYKSDVPRILASAQAFVLSSRSEGFPRSILEAMRAGLPVVTSDVGGVREAVVSDRTGYVVPVGDPAALRARLGTLLSDAELRGHMGRASRDRYEELFTFEKMFAATLKVYDQVLPDL
jgi:glycosyltransferase involved in cell wall biosynthesis